MSKQLIKECALELFNSRGYEGASIRDITKGANLSASTFYSHYPSKEELYFDLIDECFEMLKAVGEEYLKSENQDSPEERLFNLVRVRMEFFFNHRSQYSFLVRNAFFPPESIQERTQQRVYDWEEYFYNMVSQVIEDGKAAGRINATPTDAIARSILRFIAGLGMQIITHRETPEVSDARLKEAWEIYMAGILTS